MTKGNLNLNYNREALKVSRFFNARFSSQSLDFCRRALLILGGNYEN